MTIASEEITLTPRATMIRRVLFAVALFIVPSAILLIGGEACAA